MTYMIRQMGHVAFFSPDPQGAQRMCWRYDYRFEAEGGLQ